jgi:hypothetical protein
MEKSDHGHWRLRPRRERPCDRAANERDELASRHGLPQPDDHTYHML